MHTMAFFFIKYIIYLFAERRDFEILFLSVSFRILMRFISDTFAWLAVHWVHVVMIKMGAEIPGKPTALWWRNHRP